MLTDTCILIYTHTPTVTQMPTHVDSDTQALIFCPTPIILSCSVPSAGISQALFLFLLK